MFLICDVYISCVIQACPFLRIALLPKATVSNIWVSQRPQNHLRKRFRFFGPHFGRIGGPWVPSWYPRGMPRRHPRAPNASKMKAKVSEPFPQMILGSLGHPNVAQRSIRELFRTASGTQRQDFCRANSKRSNHGCYVSNLSSRNPIPGYPWDANWGPGGSSLGSNHGRVAVGIRL